MALSTLNLPLPALEDLISLTPKKIGPRLTRDIRRDILLLRELSVYEDEAEYTCLNPGRHHKTWVTGKVGEELTSECLIE